MRSDNSDNFIVLNLRGALNVLGSSSKNDSMKNNLLLIIL